MTAARVIVVIVNWNGAEFLADCLRAVAAQQLDGGVAPLLIDNGSTDGSLELLARDFPQVPVVRAANNYTAANNLGVARATGPYALLLNTDATLQPGCLAALVQELERAPRAAVAAPKILFPDGRVASTGIVQRDDLYWLDRDQGATDDGRTARGGEVLGVSGCCALFRTAAWRQVGGQDEAFHMYYEDVDLALRLRAAGFISLYVPAATCVHVGHGSISKATTGKDELGERNRLLVLARHFKDRLAGELVRSPWFQSAPPEQVAVLLPRLAARRGGTADQVLLELLLALRDQVRGYAGELDARWGEHRNLPKILGEREQWIAMLLEELRRLRIWRLPGKRLKPGEAEFLARRRGTPS
ncbi:MAG TPA: glycosyltransferase family 2 protein [Planctomycetota bacterium]|nr:glycosyltransferase family 2 protein [Planctomycetota bacterium]